MNIIIGLTEHIGDIIACEPVARYLRKKYPRAHISWAVLHAYRDLIDENPFVDETVTVDCLTDWIRLTKHESYDKVVDLHVNYRVCSHCRIPLIKEVGNPFVNAYEWFDHGALLEAFSYGAGLPKLSAQPKMYIRAEDVDAVNSLDLPRDYCVIHRESNNIDKDWTAENWVRFAEWIQTELKLSIVEIGAGKSLAASPLDGLATSLINRTSILQTAEVIRRARFFVGIDSGPAHMANATSTPGIVLLGRLNVFRQYTPFTGFYASDAPEVKLVRNLNGPARENQLDDVIAATNYVAKTLETRRAADLENFSAARVSSGRSVAENNRAISVPVTPARAHDKGQVIASGYFDPAWYTVQYPDADNDAIDPLDHFITIGGARGYSPGAEFDAAHYLKMNVDVAKSGINPLLHFIDFGSKEGRYIKSVSRSPEGGIWPDLARSRAREQASGFRPRLSAPLDREDESGDSVKAADGSSQAVPRTFAFYLPQFHPIAENNLAHGAGFTEWTNVIKTEPLFKGHYQPRIPGELGYYDLRSFETMREQVRLAIEHGITGFCFYYYYFHGKKLLYKPVENYINSDIEAPFLFLWANENWSKRWDGGNNEVIIAQEHSDEDDLAFIRDLMPVFRDKRYVKVNGKPVLLIYKTHLFPNILGTTEIWRAEMERLGFPGIYLVMVDDWVADPVHPRMLGFDASYEIPSNIVPQQVVNLENEELDLVKDFRGRIVDYEKFAHYHMSRPFPELKSEVVYGELRREVEGGGGFS
ncbi:ADP-heptose:LPS heptosyltransferase [Burkholderia sp. Ch1-1]|nr:ADP-heptose:LPS heptosyltransferase [Burkholderia sp. Ch1-1]